MIYVIDYNDEIIETLDTNEDYILSADMSWNVNTLESTFTFQILNEHSTNLQKRVRVLARDNKGKLREFIVLQIEQSLDGITEVSCVGSYLEDLLTAKPLKPTTLSQQTTSQSLSYFLADTGIKVSDSNEYGGVRTVSWTGWSDRLSNAKMLQTTYDMRLDFYIEVDKHKVSGRYGRLISKKYLNVSTLEDDNPNFKGGEIVYGENMLNLKRSIDHTEVRTALIALGPENSETGERIIIDYKDEDAQSQFGLPGRYLYDLYEPESSDENMTESRLRTLAKTHLNKLNKSAISYEVDSLSLYADVGDMIRVKNEDFTPELYVDAEIIAIDYDLISEVEKYQFGVINEYDRSQVMKNVQKILDEVRERIKNSDANIDQIIRDYEELENVYEPKIVKGPTPPESPRLGDLWLDTSDPNVAILKRYENGKWVKSSVSNVEEIGGITREEAIYLDLKDRNLLNTETYSDFTRQMNELKNGKYYHYISNEYNPILNNAYNQLYNAYNDFINSYQSINAESPTINKLTDALSKDIKFIEAYNRAKKVLDQVRTAYNDYLVILQNQYSDEKFNEAMTEVAEAIGGTFDGTKIIADVPNKQELEDLNTSIKQYLNGEITALDGKLGKQIETTVNQAKDEFSVAIESVEKKVDGIEIGGRNLLRDSKNIRIASGDGSNGVLDFSNSENLIRIEAISNKIWSQNFYNTAFANSWVNKEEIFSNLQQGVPCTLSMEVRYKGSSQVHIGFTINGNASDYFFDITRSEKITDTDNKWVKISATMEKTSGLGANSDLIGEFDSVETGDTLEIRNIKLEEDVEQKISNISQTVTKNSSSIGLLENQIALKVNSSEVTQQLNEALKPVKSNIQTNNAELLLQKNLIEQKVSKSDYTTDMNGVVKRLSTSEGKISTLEKEIKLKVTETDVQNKIDNMEIGGRNLSVDTLERNRPSKNTGVSSDNFNYESYYTTEPIQSGKDYTIHGFVEITDGDFDRVTVYDYPSGNREVAILEEGGYFSTTIRARGQGSDRFLIYNGLSGATRGNGAIFRKVKIEKGNKPTDWTPAPEDMEDRITTAEGSITVNSDAIKQKVSYEEINKTNKTLERVISELIVDVRGISYQYDVNGMISGFTLNKDYFKLNHNLIDINNGDVVIKNGTTTIKQAVINNGHISELSFDKLKGGTATFGGPEQNGTFEVLDVNGNAIMKADYEQATVSELSMGTIKAESVISDSVVEVMRLPREYIVNKTKYGYLEEAVTLNEVNPNIANGTTREIEISGSTTQSLTHTFNEIAINETLTAGETYTVSFDISNVVGPNSGFIDLRPYEADNGSITVDIRSGRVEATWTQNVDSKKFLIYRDVIGQSRYDISFTISNVKIENGDKATTYVEQITDKESSDTVEVWYAGSIQQAVDSIPTYIRDYVHIFIDTVTDDDKVILEGHVGNGWIRFYYNIKKNYNSFYFNNKIRVDIYGGGSDRSYNTGLFPYEGPVIEYHKNDYSLIRNLNLHGDGGPLTAVNVREGSSLLIRDCNFYNVDNGISVTENSVATAINFAGTAEKYGWSVNWGSSIRGSGTVRPMGKISSRFLSNGGRDDTNFTVETPPKVTNPPKVVVPKRITKRWTTTSARHFYRSSPTNFTVTFMRDYPIQGRWNDSWGYRDGAWFVGTSMRNTLLKKKIIKIRVSVGRSSANSQGYTGSRKFTLRMHKMANKPASNKNPTVSYGSATYSGNLAFGERKWFDVTSAFKSEIASGTFYGFGVRASTSSYYEYMALAKSLTIEVTYEE